MSYQRSRILASACACVLGIAANDVFAQGAPAKPAAGTGLATEIEEVTVTGSFIPTLPQDAAISVEVIDFEQLKNLGRPSNLDLVKNLTEVGYSIGELNRNNGFPIDAETINLRSLGPRFTTVVFNNRRFPEQFSPGVGRFNNIQSIPNAAIGSVEVLRTGGAAIYGADAVAGVVNYITRKNVTGFELNADYRYILGSNGDYNLSGLWGGDVAGGNLMVVAGWQHRSRLDQIDRDFSNKQYLENPYNGATGGWNVINEPPDFSFQRPFGATGAQTIYTPFGNTANGLPVSPTNPIAANTTYVGQRQISGVLGSGVVRDPGCQGLGGYAGWSATPSPVCYGKVSSIESLVEHSDDYSLYSEYNLKFADSMKFHWEGLFYYRNLPDINVRTRSFPTVYPLNPASVTAGRINSNANYFVSGLNPAVANFLNSMFLNQDNTTAFTAPQIAAITSTTNPGRAQIAAGTWAPFTTSGNPLGPDFDVQKNTTTQYRTSLSLGGGLPSFWGMELDWEVAATLHYVKDTRSVHDILVDRLQAALNGLGGPNCTGTAAGANGCQFLNPFSSAFPSNISTGAPSNYYVGAGTFPGYTRGLTNDPNLVQWMYVQLSLERIYKLGVFDPIIRGTTGLNLWGGPIKFAVGAQARYSTEDTNVDDLSDINTTPCATIGVVNCTSRVGPLALNRQNGVMGANQDTYRRFPVYATFLELDLPIVKSLDLDIAGRYEKFISDYTDRHNDVVVPSASIKWTPVSWLSFRSSWGLTFGQVNPPRYELPSPTTVSAVTGFTGTGSFSATGSPPNNFTSYNYHNLDTKPEKGENISVGFIVQAGQFRASVDYGLVTLSDYSRTLNVPNVVNALVVPGQNLNAPLTAILINCSSPLLTQTFASLVDDPNNPVPRTIVQLNPNNNCTQGTTTLQALVGGRLNYFGQQGETNAGKLWSNAIDMTASYVFDMGSAGTFTPTFDGTYITKWFFGDFNLFGIPVARGFDGVGYRNTSAGRLGAAGQGAIPQYRLTLSLLYQKDKHTFNAQMRYVPSIIDDVVAGVPSLAINSSTPSSLTNANIGPVTGGAGCATVPTAANPTLISNLGSVPAGAGTAEYGSYCSAQNVTVLSGYKIASYFNLDLIYRFAVTDNISINAVIDNALNKDPSFARDQLGYDAGFGSPLGRTYQLGATIKF